MKFIVLNSAGHFVYREQPEQFNADLIQFIEFWSGRNSARDESRTRAFTWSGLPASCTTVNGGAIA